MIKRDARIEQTARLEQNRQVTPTNQHAPPTHQQAPPTHQQAPPTHQQAPPTHQQAPPTHQQAPPSYQFDQQQQLQQRQQQQYQLGMQQLQQQQYQLQFQQQQLQQQQQQLQANGASRVQPYQAQLSPRQAAACLGQVVPPSPARRYRAKTAKTLGILQIVLAIVSLVLGIVTAAIGAWGAVIGVPIWGGICFYLPAGILGVLSTKPTNMQNCVITSCMTMSVLSSLAAGTSLIMSCIAAASEYDYYSYYPVLNVGNTIMDAILAIVAFTEVVVAITQSAFCCKYRCACCNTPSQAVQVTTPVRYASPHTHNMQPPMPYQQQQRQQQQFTMLQQRQVPAYRAQGIVPLQSAPRDTQPAHPNSVSDYLRSPDESHASEPELPAYSDSPPPSYSLSTGYM